MKAKKGSAEDHFNCHDVDANSKPFKFALKPILGSSEREALDCCWNVEQAYPQLRAPVCHYSIAA